MGTLAYGQQDGRRRKFLQLKNINGYTQHAHPKYSIDCSSVERLSERSLKMAM
jgi:hypothetical protein